MRKIDILNKLYTETTAEFIITSPTGLGNNYDMLSIDSKVYGSELNFQDIKLTLNFGVNSNAYVNYNALMEFLKDNTAVISYNYGNGIRYADVRLKQAPKTEKQSNSLITAKFTFERLTPWYTRETSVNITNTFKGMTIKPVITFTPAGPNIDIQLQRVSDSVVIQTISLVDAPAQETTIDCENKTVKLADGTSAYSYVDKSSNTFIEVPDDDIEYTIIFSATSGESVTYKEWVID